MCTNQGFKSFVPGPSVDSTYLYYCLKKLVPRIQSLGNGATFKEVSKAVVGDVVIPLPYPDDPKRSLAEQKRIAAILDKADAIRRRRKKIAQIADQLIPSIFNELFGDTLLNQRNWQTLELQQVVAEGTDITYGIVQCGPHIEDGVPYIRTSDISDQSVPAVETLGRTSTDIADRFARSQIRAGELVYGIRASVGSVIMIPPELDGANLTQGTARVSPGPQVLGLYLIWALRSHGLQVWVSRQCKGATFREITLRRLRQMPIPVPPLSLQQEFCEIVSSVGKRQDAIDRARANAEDLFNSLVQRAFRGEL